ncbi:MAG TPA: M3 family oligoendopeptidase [Candidatus Baltobacteraceae bacterium]|nr:M3 family oligoendopeptidase [Candidatus Baltobacteraceae bacterium]
MAGLPDTAAGVRWDLSDLFAAPDDPKIAALLTSSQERAVAFASAYRGKIGALEGPTPEIVLRALQDLEGLNEQLQRGGAYAALLYAADTSRPEHRDLREKVELALTEIGNTVLFFDLEWVAVPDAAATRIMEDPQLATYCHFLQQARRLRPHILSEPEERLLNERDNTGSRAFGRLFTELLSSLTFPLERDGEAKALTLSELLALSHEPDRALRRRAHETLYNVLADKGLVLTFVYDTLVQDHLTMDRLRRFPDPMAARHLSNEIDPAAVERMLAVTEANYGIAQRYFRVKAQLLDLPRLAVYDQYAPVGRELPSCNFADAQRIVLEAFREFSPEFAAAAQQFFDKRWIDAEVRPGKQDGAFCSSPAPSLHPYVLTNYTGNLRDVMTVAHELGHGVHGCLARAQTYFNYDTPLTTAETASVFGEYLVFDRLLTGEADPEVQLALLCGKIEDACATVFRQTVLTRFEQAAFRERGSGRFTSEALARLWLEANQRYYGDAVEMTEAYRGGWSYIPHFIHSRFYCYSYVFGELLVLSLYRRYKEEGAAFVPKYLALLTAGGSAAPEDLLKPLGVDLQDPKFWQQGFDEIERLVAQVETLASQIGRRSTRPRATD